METWEQLVKRLKKELGLTSDAIAQRHKIPKVIIHTPRTVNRQAALKVMTTAPVAVNEFQSAFDEMAAKKLIHGVIPTRDRIGKSLAYFNLRNIFLDCRGILKIHPTSEWGWFVTVITMSHNMTSGQITDGSQIFGAVNRTVLVDECAWIGSNALLYNCHIQHHAAVACGAVVRNAVVEPYTVVEGNPARVIKRFTDGHWVHIDEGALAPFRG